MLKNTNDCVSRLDQCIDVCRQALGLKANPSGVPFLELSSAAFF